MDMLAMARDVESRIRVVLADDDEDWRDLLAGSLEKAGYEVEQVADGRELRKKLEALESMGESPDLIVSDHRMPHATGLEVLEWASGRTLDVPFILLSAFAGPYIRGPALTLGAAAVFDKPVDIDMLQEQIVEILAQRSRADGAAPDSVS